MQISVDLSYYPLKNEFIEPIRAFIDHLNQYDQWEIVTTGMSTQIFGEYDYVMENLTKTIKQSFENPHSVFVMKVVNLNLKSM